MKKAILVGWDLAVAAVLAMVFVVVFFVPIFCMLVAEVLLGQDQWPIKFRQWLYRRQWVEGTHLGSISADLLVSMLALALWLSLPLWATVGAVCSVVSFLFLDCDDCYAE